MVTMLQKKIKLKNEDKKGLLSMAACLLLLAAGYLVFLQPKELFLQEAEAKIKENTLRITAVEDYLAAHNNSYDQDLQEAEKRELKAKALLPEKMNTEEFCALLQKKAREDKVRIEKLQLKEAENDKDYAQQEIAVSAKGDFFALRQFFRDIEQGPRFASIESMEIKAGENLLTADFTVRIYSKK